MRLYAGMSEEFIEDARMAQLAAGHFPGIPGSVVPVPAVQGRLAGQADRRR